MYNNQTKPMLTNTASDTSLSWFNSGSGASRHENERSVSKSGGKKVIFQYFRKV